MVKTLVWPWKNEEELLEVRQLLYPDAQLSNEARREQQQLGVNIVNTWKLRRCRIPHSIQATADLVDAILHHDAAKNSSSTIRAVYASAIAKMVTSICDLEQDSVEKRSMMDQAKKINMPQDWVHIRHLITHGQMPGLRTLEATVRDAVPWMWGHFWKHLAPEDEVSEDELRFQLHEIFTAFRRQRRADITAKQDAAVTTMPAATASKAIHKLCKKHVRGSDVLISVLLENRGILLSQKQASPKFRALLLIWDDLLLHITAREPKFLRAFVTSLVDRFQYTSAAPEGSDEEYRLVMDWVCHILTNPTWVAQASPPELEELRGFVVESCLLFPHSQTRAVVEKMLKVMSGSQAEALAHLAAMSYGEENEVIGSMDVEGGDTITAEDATIWAHGWRRPVDVWIPRPIGV